ncbi:MAG: hypothetical protein GYA24_21000 [Candidatus Lokiarchaeota archaeon]|nr:hypothetical protein [Candidatus Lokiarchaeota archaeon]
MKKLPQLIVTIAVFIGSTIGIDFLVGAMVATDVTGVYLTSFGTFPGQTGLTYIENYLGFLQADTLGWFTYIMSSASQSLETLASSLYVAGSGLGAYLTYSPTSGSAIGIIPILIEYHPLSSTPQVFMPTLAALIRLIAPFIITGIVAGAVAKEKKDAIRNTLLTFVIVGLAGIVLNIVHIIYNFPLSYDWKFDAYLMLNPAFLPYYQMSASLAMASPVDARLAIGMMFGTFNGIIAIIYALVNGLIISIVSVLVAAKK